MSDYEKARDEAAENYAESKRNYQCSDCGSYHTTQSDFLAGCKFTRAEILESKELKALIVSLEKSRKQVHKLWLMADTTKMTTTFIDADDCLVIIDDALSNFKAKFGGVGG